MTSFRIADVAVHRQTVYSAEHPQGVVHAQGSASLRVHIKEV